MSAWEDRDRGPNIVRIDYCDPLSQLSIGPDPWGHQRAGIFDADGVGFLGGDADGTQIVRYRDEFIDAQVTGPPLTAGERAALDPMELRDAAWEDSEGRLPLEAGYTGTFWTGRTRPANPAVVKAGAAFVRDYEARRVAGDDQDAARDAVRAAELQAHAARMAERKRNQAEAREHIKRCEQARALAQRQRIKEQRAAAKAAAAARREAEAGGRAGKPGIAPLLTEEAVQRARVLYVTEQLAFAKIGAQLIAEGLVTDTTVARRVRDRLRGEWERRGWPTRSPAEARRIVARREAAAAAAPPEPLRVIHNPRLPRAKPKPYRFDEDLELRRSALEAFVHTGSFLPAARLIWQQGFSSPESCAASLRHLATREGWLPAGDRSQPSRDRRAQAARVAVRRALAEGTWDRIDVPAPRPSARRVCDERLVHDAAWLYFYDGLSFLQVAERLFARSPAKSPKILKAALIDEWNRRGWERRTAKAANRGYTPPTDEQRCVGIDGEPCTRWARAGSRYCAGHDPADAVARRRHARIASESRNADALPIGPWRAWLRERVQEVGSVAAVRRRAPVVSYDTYADWTARRSAGDDDMRIRLSTINKVLEAWGDGTTVEDIYGRPAVAA